MANLEESVEFALNPDPRVACVLILDTSGSMAGEKITQLNAGLVTLRADLDNDERARRQVEIAIVEFNSSVRVVQDFVTVEHFQPPRLTASGGTDLAGGVHQALDLLRRRKKQYDDNDVPCYRPWAFLITDGEVNTAQAQQVAVRIREDTGQKRVALFVVGVQGANEASLRQIVAEPRMLSGVKFQELFSWLSTSLKSVSQSTPGVMVPLPTTGTWEAVG
jgi:uncharacterized protein YegL